MGRETPRCRPKLLLTGSPTSALGGALGSDTSSRGMETTAPIAWQGVGPQSGGGVGGEALCPPVDREQKEGKELAMGGGDSRVAEGGREQRRAWERKRRARSREGGWWQGLGCVPSGFRLPQPSGT